MLAVDLDDKGSVTGAAVIEPKQPTGLGFEEAALTAAYDLVFEPAESAGKPVAVQIIYKFKFPAPPPPKPAERRTADAHRRRGAQAAPRRKLHRQRWSSAAPACPCRASW